METDGLLIFFGEDYDYEFLYIESGFVHYKVSSGGSSSVPMHLESSVVVDDGKWHRIIIERDGKDVSLTVDDQKESEIIVNSDNELEGNDRLFLGGKPTQITSPKITVIPVSS